MTQDERRRYLIDLLLAEDPRYKDTRIPGEPEDQWRLLRSLMNIRPAKPAGEAFLRVQDAYLSGLIAENGIVDAEALTPAASDPRLRTMAGGHHDAENRRDRQCGQQPEEGCWQPCHACIDNCIHTFAGVQLRLRCHELMAEQGHGEPTGTAKLTPGYNLPAKYVLHTVGPIVEPPPTERDCGLLASCYTSCLKLASENRLPRRRVLLHFHRGVPFSEGKSGGDRRANRKGVHGARHGGRTRRVQCFHAGGRGHLPAIARLTAEKNALRVCANGQR
jgi:hypothetical protein